MFLVFFLLFTLIFTIFENISIAIISLLLMCIGLTTYQLISKRKVLSKKIMRTILLLFILAMSTFVVKERRYYDVSESFLNPPSFPPLSRETIIWTGIIADISTQGKYTFIYKNADYLLYSKKEYAIGDQIRVVWRIQENIKKDWFSYRTIWTWTFAIPLFSWSFDFDKWMKMKWWKGAIYEDNSLLLGDEAETNPSASGTSPYQGRNADEKIQSIGFIKKMKRGLQEKIIQAYGKNRVSGLILGMLIGDRSQIPESEYQSFINSGLVHLVAVSGGNILMIVVFLQCILFFVPFYARLGLILLTIIGYSLICWLDSSVFRAVLMWGMSMVALFWGREINIWRLLSISCIVMLIINPYFLAYDTGFLLSYSALIGIVYFQNNDKWEMIDDKCKKPKQNRLQKIMWYTYKSYIAPSIWASIGIFPVIIFFMGKINLLGVVGNLFVLPIVPFVMIYGFVSVWLYSCFGWEWLLWIEKFSVQYIYKISELLSQYGIYFMVSGLRFKYVILLVFVVFFVIWRIKSPFVSPSIKGDK